MLLSCICGPWTIAFYSHAPYPAVSAHYTPGIHYNMLYMEQGIHHRI